MILRQNYISGGRGFHLVTHGVAPGAGNNYTLQLQSDRLHLLRYLAVNLATDANAANRVIMLHTNDGVAEYMKIWAGLIQTASQNITYHFALNVPYVDHFATVGQVMNTLPDAYMIPRDQVFTIEIYGKQAADTLSTIKIVTEEFYV